MAAMGAPRDVVATFGARGGNAPRCPMDDVPRDIFWPKEVVM